MKESRFTYESMTDCIAAAEQEANRSSLQAAKYAKLAREFRGYTVGY
jgi:hypothetical protein